MTLVALACVALAMGCAPEDEVHKVEDCTEANGAVGEWRQIRQSVETGAGEEVAVWSGGELLVWGGSSCGYACASGARFDPNAGTWRALPSAGATPRAMAAGAWTGRELVVWGGVGNSERETPGHPVLNGGEAFNVETESWIAIEQGESITPRARHQAFFVPPNQLLIWGGIGANAQGETFGDFLIGGGLIDLASGAWTPLPELNAPKTISASLAWTGRELIVWGGVDRETCAPSTYGAIFDPLTWTWRPMTDVESPPPHQGPAVWTGSEFIVWGGKTPGLSGEAQTPGGAYDPRLDAWRPVSMSGAPEIHSAGAVWTGSRVVVWGGNRSCPSGGVYDPATDRWQPTTLRGAPAPRARFHSFWTGGDVLVYGGQVGEGGALDSRDGALLRSVGIWTLRM